jgi:hypothetical protein
LQQQGSSSSSSVGPAGGQQQQQGDAGMTAEQLQEQAVMEAELEQVQWSAAAAVWWEQRQGCLFRGVARYSWLWSWSGAASVLSLPVQASYLLHHFCVSSCCTLLLLPLPTDGCQLWA